VGETAHPAQPSPATDFLVIAGIGHLYVIYLLRCHVLRPYLRKNVTSLTGRQGRCLLLVPALEIEVQVGCFPSRRKVRI
jgi:hypothetical protein